MGADGFTSPPKKVVLRIIIAIKNRQSSAGFEAANLGSNGNHANNYTTEADNHSLSQGGPNLSSLFLVVPKRQETPPGPIFENYKQLPLTVFLQKLPIIIIHAEI
jgi:hypothetical protein